ncbi:MAG: hypothetical protein COZ68_01575, partial [Deltaproteobacteria bacterium CG_4_8_14_3_um_filter_43_13]
DGSQFVNRYDDPRYERFAGYSKIIVDTGKDFSRRQEKQGVTFSMQPLPSLMPSLLPRLPKNWG